MLLIWKVEVIVGGLRKICEKRVRRVVYDLDWMVCIDCDDIITPRRIDDGYIAEIINDPEGVGDPAMLSREDGAFWYSRLYQDTIFIVGQQ